MKNPTRFYATPVTANMIATVIPAMVEPMRDVPGIIVEKLLPTMNDEKQAGGTHAKVNKKNIAIASGPPMAATIAS